MLKMLIKNNLVKMYVFVLVIIIASLGILQYYQNHYYDNYFDKNKKILLDLQGFIDDNNLNGSFHLSSTNEFYSVYNTGGLYQTCVSERRCFVKHEDFIDIMNRISLVSIEAYKKHVGLLGEGEIDTGVKWVSFYVNQKYWLYGNGDNFIYYSPGFYTGKKEISSFDGNEFHVIEKIFNDDWGVINGCYSCGGGGWD